ncbi:cysteine-rich CWC family protein [Burkholderia cepacia]|uniref:cysteine-rich CWC family protein n=1 Tax=Burkholderia cepacia TaxID=292 RepID=UPI0009BB3C4C|nr:cysteine-rich CWC family protein [Burkholderia cepacia]
MTDSAAAAAARSAPHRARCPRCGRGFDCGARTQPFDCWCASMPALPGGGTQPAAGARCRCPECLADEIAQRMTGAAG